MKSEINYGKIKREILKRDTGFDTRFVTKVGKQKNKYSRKGKFDFFVD